MGRRNRRVETFAPLDLTPSDLNTPPHSEAQWAVRHARNRESDRGRSERQQRARINRGIDWSSCVIPGCGKSLRTHGASFGTPAIDRRDASLDLPMCYDHAAVVWKALARSFVSDPKFIEAVADVNERLQQRESRELEERKASKRANITHGDIYFVRVGGLVKVGWTRDLWARLKSYGAAAELLVTYPGSRDDETNLHRQLRPALAKGREWYHDGDVIAHFINEALAKYGMPPTFESLWTEPKRVVAGKKAARYRT